jgi:asparagine synthase (glutamine-hydrolysing)
LTAIAGIWRLDGRPDAGEGCARMLAPLAMYGRDGVGAWDGGHVALGRRLQRVLPEDVFDRQPLHGHGGVVLVADVRLDNRAELEAELGLPDAQFHQMSDAAVMLAAYERWETDSFDRLAGDYACAIWDGARRRLVLARDPTGRRPLCYHRSGAFIAFATMPKGLHALAEVPYEADEARIAQFLLGPSAGVGPPFKGISQIGAGCFVIATQGGLETRRHWRPQPDSVRLASADDYAQRLRELLDQAVAARLRGVSEVGAHLSAGLDSSAVAATAARLLTPKGGRVHAFTAVPREGYDERAASGRLIDEGPLAAATAGIYPNIQHSRVRTKAVSPLATLDRNFELYEQPIPNLCNGVWIDSINAAARERGLQVMLVGDLGNIGLSYAGGELWPELLASGRWVHWLNEGRAMTARGARWRGVLAGTFGAWWPEPMWRVASRLNGSGAPARAGISLIHPERIGAARPRPPSRPRRAAFPVRFAALRDGGAVTHKGVLAEYAIDIRDPTADRRVLDFCLGAPTDQFLRNGRMRALARRALADRLPAEVLDSPMRGLQAADWHEGLTADRERLADEIARLEVCPSAAAMLDLPRTRRLLEDWPQSGWHRPQIVEAYRVALMRGISAGHFLRRVACA